MQQICTACRCRCRRQLDFVKSAGRRRGAILHTLYGKNNGREWDGFIQTPLGQQRDFRRNSVGTLFTRLPLRRKSDVMVTRVSASRTCCQKYRFRNDYRIGYLVGQEHTLSPGPVWSSVPSPGRPTRTVWQEPKVLIDRAALQGASEARDITRSEVRVELMSRFGGSFAEDDPTVALENTPQGAIHGRLWITTPVASRRCSPGDSPASCMSTHFSNSNILGVTGLTSHNVGHGAGPPRVGAVITVLGPPTSNCDPGSSPLLAQMENPDLSEIT